MKKLIVDIGNTRIKLLSYTQKINEKPKSFYNKEEFISYINQEKLYNNKVIISSVRSIEETEKIISLFKNYISLSETTPIPIINTYETPETLGKDRLANAIAVQHIKPNNNNLVIDVGTCLKFDFINKENKYIGGSISLGLLMRYKALNNFTDNLPLYSNKTTNSLIGKNTEESIKSGVYIGMISEIKQFIKYYENKYEQLNIFLTGGDLSYFKHGDLSQKNTIFADPLLTLKGLKGILDYNE